MEKLEEWGGRKQLFWSRKNNCKEKQSQYWIGQKSQASLDCITTRSLLVAESIQLGAWRQNGANIKIFPNFVIIMGLFLEWCFVVRMFFKKLWNWSPKHECVFYIDFIVGFSSKIHHGETMLKQKHRIEKLMSMKRLRCLFAIDVIVLGNIF
jgi:hypothetical protein